MRVVARYAGRQDMTLPLARSHLEALELLDDRQQPGTPLGLGPRGHVLPASQKPHVVGDGGRLHMPAPTAPAGRVQAHQQVTGAPPTVGQFDGRAGRLQARQDDARAAPGHGHRCTPDGARGEWLTGHQLADRHRTCHFEMAAHALGQRFVARGHRVGHGPVQSFSHGQALGRCPTAGHQGRTTVHLQLLEPVLPCRHRSAKDQREKEIV